MTAHANRSDPKNAQIDHLWDIIENKVSNSHPVIAKKIIWRTVSVNSWKYNCELNRHFLFALRSNLSFCLLGERKERQNYRKSENGIPYCLIRDEGKFVETEPLNKTCIIPVLWWCIATLYKIASAYWSMNINLSELFHGQLIIIKSDIPGR